MPQPKFLQIHTLHSYPAALLNRDASGLAKRMPFGGATRTRISSQCLKRHWRMAEGEFALRNIDGFTDARRTRNAVPLKIMKDLRTTEGLNEEVLNAVENAFQEKLYSESGVQPLLLGLPEIKYLQQRAASICADYANDAAGAKKAAEDVFHTRRGEGNNMRAMREATKLPAGLVSALFGRMITSDITANIDAAVHVAHAFTVHAEESESDYFSAVEELPMEAQGSGAGFLGDMELTAGLFYGYVVVDVPGLVSNLSGSETLAGQVVHNLIHLIATVSPGAKLGSTAPYANADLMLIEAGSRQPRSLANAFRKAVSAQTDTATDALEKHLSDLDECYGAKEARRVMSVGKRELPGASWLNCDELANWAADAVRDGEAG